jgi:hypothetical protein
MAFVGNEWEPAQALRREGLPRHQMAGIVQPLALRDTIEFIIGKRNIANSGVQEWGD